MKNLVKLCLVLFACVSLVSCGTGTPKQESAPTRIPVLIDTDANNELDDQFALAYLFVNQDVFDVVGVTVNATRNGGAIDEHHAEAKRVMQLCNVYESIPLHKGANADFDSIMPFIQDELFDGSAAVDFIIAEANKPREEKLVLLPVGKLTNIALALLKDPGIASKINIVWLGSNYPERGEYNKENDVASMNYILALDVPFEMVTVRYGKESGTAHVYVVEGEVQENLTGKGVEVEPVEGRHGGTFTRFGDYAANLLDHCDYYGTPPHRSLFDMAAVAILKNPSWAEKKEIPCPALVENGWVEQPNNTRKIVIWENFDREAIVGDLYKSFSKE